jgi:hypothetical protein
MALWQWKSVAGLSISQITFASIPNHAGRQGMRGDLGAGTQGWWKWYLKTKVQAGPGLNFAGSVDLYFSTWNNDTGPSDPDGGGFITKDADQPFSLAEGLENLRFAGSANVDNLSGMTLLSASRFVYFGNRFVTPILWNRSGAPCSANPADTEIWVTSLPQGSTPSMVHPTPAGT